MWDVKACRGCLSTEGDLERATTVLRKIFESVSGFQFPESDGLPPYLCAWCRWLLRRAVALRRRCRRAVLALRHAAANKTELLEDDIAAISRKRHNLLPPLSAWTTHAEYKLHDIDAQHFLEPLTAVIEKNHVVVHELRAADAPPSEPDDDGGGGGGDWAGVDDADGAPEPPPEDREPENVFEGLEEPLESESDGLEDLFDACAEPAPRRARAPPPTARRRLETALQGYRVAAGADASSDKKAIAVCFARSEIQQVTPHQQQQWFLKRLELPAYINATHKCSVCVKTFENMEQLKTHCMGVHKRDCRGSRTRVACPICGRNFATKVLCTIHRAHEHDYVYRCTLCPASCLNVASLRAHMVRHGVISAWRGRRRRHAAVTPQTPADWRASGAPARDPGGCDVCAFTPDAGLRRDEAARRLNWHRKKHNRPGAWFAERLLCDICRTWHTSKLRLENHMRQLHRSRYRCHDCGETFLTLPAYNKHTPIHYQTLKCDVEGCNYIATDETLFSYHQLTDHVAPGAHHCPLCGAQHPTPCQLYHHQLTAHGFLSLPSGAVVKPDAYCTDCSLQFESADALQVHEDNHEQSYPRVCRDCDETFETKNKYCTHPCVKGEDSVFPTMCKLCDTLLSDWQLYHRHYARAHSAAGPQTLAPRRPGALCHRCGQTFSYKAFNRHAALPSCSDALLWSGPRHFVRGSYTCTQCPHRTITAARMYHHTLRVHVAKPYRCRRCGKRYDRRKINDHMMTHEPVRRERCEICNKNYKNHSYLKVHMFKVHNIRMRRTAARARKRHMWLRRAFVYKDVEVDCTLLNQNVIDDLEVTLYSLRDEYLSDVTDQKLDYLKRFDDELYDEELESRFARRMSHMRDRSARYRRTRSERKQREAMMSMIGGEGSMNPSAAGSVTATQETAAAAAEAIEETELAPKKQSRITITKNEVITPAGSPRDMPSLDQTEQAGVPCTDIPEAFRSPKLIVKKNVAERVFHAIDGDRQETIIVKKPKVRASAGAQTRVRNTLQTSAKNAVQMPLRSNVQTPVRITLSKPVRTAVRMPATESSSQILHTLLQSNAAESPMKRKATPTPETHSVVVKMKKDEKSVRDDRIEAGSCDVKEESQVKTDQVNKEQVLIGELMPDGKLLVDGEMMEFEAENGEVHAQVMEREEGEEITQQILELDSSAFDNVDGDKYVSINGQLFKVVM